MFHQELPQIKNRIEYLKDLISEKVKGDGWINILSIDLDCLDSADFKSCSAVNPSGLSLDELECIIDVFNITVKSPKFFGFYEYNPIL